jgi:hypothetical protein
MAGGEQGRVIEAAANALSGDLRVAWGGQGQRAAAPTLVVAAALTADLLIRDDTGDAEVARASDRLGRVPAAFREVALASAWARLGAMKDALVARAAELGWRQRGAAGEVVADAPPTLDGVRAEAVVLSHVVARLARIERRLAPQP